MLTPTRTFENLTHPTPVSVSESLNPEIQSRCKSVIATLQNLSEGVMISNRIICTPIFRSLLKLRSPSNRLNNPLLALLMLTNSSDCSWIFVRHISGGFTREPLGVFFRRAVGAPQKSENSDFHAEEDDSDNEQVRGLKQKLRNLEEEIRGLNRKRPEKASDLNGKGSLLSLFANEKRKAVEASDFGLENPIVHKALSSDMCMFAQHLYDHGYFKNANFIPRNVFDVTCFEASYGREYLKFAAVSFGKNHQQIAKWLSAKDLKMVVLFGCPSLGQKSVYAAKHMRRFFKSDEQKVCQRCVVKDSCEHGNKGCKNASTQLCMADVNRVLTMYAMESVPQKLVIPREIKDCVSRLLKEIVSLTQDRVG